jgi:hypothetical protein
VLALNALALSNTSRTLADLSRNSKSALMLPRTYSFIAIKCN